MDRYILAKYDVSGIQSYIFASGQLRENVGASNNVGRILKEILPQVMIDWSAERPGSVETKWKDIKAGAFLLPGSPDILAEILYIGGGNAFVVYREELFYNEVSRLLAMKAVEECQGVTVLAAYVDVDIEDFPADRELLNQKMASMKRNLRRQMPVSSYPIVEQDSSDGSPVTRQEIRGDVSLKLSELRYEKRRGSIRAGKYALEMDEMAEQKGENSYIAVIHIDGNNMGELVEAIMDKNRSYESAVPAMRRLSMEIDRRNRKAAKAMEAAFERVFSGLPLPLRPLISDGDDMTFLCCSKAGIGAVVAYLRKLLELADEALPYSACAGIAFVHNHFPFSIAYDIAEECCSRAKGCWYKEKRSTAAYLDFQVVQGAFGKEMKEEERLESLRVRPFCVAKEVDVKKIDSIDRFRKILRRMYPAGEYNGPWPMARLHHLYEAYRKGEDQTELLKQEYASRGYLLSQLTGECFQAEREETGIFDALESMDFYDELVWHGFWNTEEKERIL